MTFSAVAEAVVDSSQPETVVASQSGLMTDGAPEIDSYMRINVSGLASPVGRATLEASLRPHRRPQQEEQRLPPAKRMNRTGLDSPKVCQGWWIS